MIPVLRSTMTLLLLITMVPAHPVETAAGNISDSQARLATRGYEIGTDIGAMYLSEHGEKLRTILLLQECGASKRILASLGAVAASFDYFYAHYEKDEAIPEDMVILLAQVTNSYALGYQVGVRAEFRNLSDQQKKEICEINTAHSGMLIQKSDS
jgi:hypothetical protein